MKLTNKEDLTMLSKDDPLPIKIYKRGIITASYIEIYGLIIGLVVYRFSTDIQYHLLPIEEFNAMYFDYFKP